MKKNAGKFIHFFHFTLHNISNVNQTNVPLNFFVYTFRKDDLLFTHFNSRPFVVTHTVQTHTRIYTQ